MAKVKQAKQAKRGGTAFIVRLSPEVHKAAKSAAYERGLSLLAFVEGALERAIAEGSAA